VLPPPPRGPPPGFKVIFFTLPRPFSFQIIFSSSISSSSVISSHHIIISSLYIISSQTFHVFVFIYPPLPPPCSHVVSTFSVYISIIHIVSYLVCISNYVIVSCHIVMSSCHVSTCHDIVSYHIHYQYQFTYVT
jgi:hypothetical protein